MGGEKRHGLPDTRIDTGRGLLRIDGIAPKQNFLQGIQTEALLPGSGIPGDIPKTTNDTMPQGRFPQMDNHRARRQFRPLQPFQPFRPGQEVGVKYIPFLPLGANLEILKSTRTKQGEIADTTAVFTAVKPVKTRTFQRANQEPVFCSTQTNCVAHGGIQKHTCTQGHHGRTEGSGAGRNFHAIADYRFLATRPIPHSPLFP